MVLYFNRGDMISFGKYLLSDERKEHYKNHPTPMKGWSLEQRLAIAHKEDLDRWKAEQKIADVMRVMDAVCAESLDPENYENWEKIRKELILVRKDL